MKRSELAAGLTCSLAAALSQIGDAWSLLIVKELMLRNRRFDGILAQTGIAESSLAARLKALERTGVVEKRAYQARPTRYEYRLTKKGEGLWPVLVTLTRWGDGWSGHEPPPLRYNCTCCGNDAEPQLACSTCSAPLEPRSVAAVQSDAMKAERAARSAT